MLQAGIAPALFFAQPRRWKLETGNLQLPDLLISRVMQPEAMAARLAPFLGGLSLSQMQLTQLQTYLDLLLRWNARINLTAIRDPEEIVTRHFGESLFAARHLYPAATPAPNALRLGPCALRLIDLGSGAGFPGLPVKIWTPGLHAVLLESKHRKATFLREVVRALKLTEVEVLTTRAEAYAPETTNCRISNCTLTLRAVERFADVLPTAVRLLEHFPAGERRLALLIGASQVQAARALAPFLRLDRPLPIPESSQRVLLIGHRPPATVH